MDVKAILTYYRDNGWVIEEYEGFISYHDVMAHFICERELGVDIDDYKNRSTLPLLFWDETFKHVIEGYCHLDGDALDKLSRSFMLKYKTRFFKLTGYEGKIKESYVLDNRGYSIISRDIPSLHEYFFYMIKDKTSIFIIYKEK